MTAFSFPLVQTFPWQEPLAVFNHFAQHPGALFLDSAGSGNYSFIAFDPFLILRAKDKQIQLGETTMNGDPFAILKAQLALYPLPRLPDLPPFQGGVAGYFGYDLVHHIEQLPESRIPHSADDLWLGFYDVVFAFDHDKKIAYLFSSGYPEKTEEARAERAKMRLDNVRQQLEAIQSIQDDDSVISSENIVSNFTKDDYEIAIKKTIDYIYAGDIFQANIAQRFSSRNSIYSPFSLYQKLRQRNPAPFSSFINTETCVIASASPERFLKLTEDKVITCPIKGTQKRSSQAQEDHALAQALINSEKDRAENIMIVDLLRNDLSKVCKPHSVNVKQLCGLETFASVHHLVSIVEGTLETDYTAVDLLRACFPGGSITGAPKVRAMEIIAEIEPHARGPYCGSVGYIGFNGDMDTSIIIRTFVITPEEISFHAGGGIVADSVPEKEYAETLIKAHALHDTLTDASKP